MTRAPDSWMPLHVTDWRGGTLSFTAAERGAYLELLLAYWEFGPLPADDDILAQLSKCRGKEWKQVRAKVLAKFTERDGALYQDRADRERAEAAERYAKRAAAGKRGGEAKAQHSSSNATAKPKPGSTTTLHNTTDVVPTTSAAEGAAVDPAKWVFDVGRGLLKTYGIASKQAGNLIGAWRKRLDDEPLLAVIAHAGQQRRHDIVEFIEGSIRKRTNGRNSSTSEQQQRADREAILAAFGHRGMEDCGATSADVDGAELGNDTEPSGRSAASLRPENDDGGDRPAARVRAGVQPADAGKNRADRELPRPTLLVAGGSDRASRESDDQQLEVGQPDADALGYPGDSGGRVAASEGMPGPRAVSAQEAQNADGLDLPDFLDRRRATG